jgi:hypothetical protein
VLYTAFGVWSVYVYVAVQESCGRNLRGVLLGCAVVSFFAAVMVICTFAWNQHSIRKFVETGDLLIRQRNAMIPKDPPEDELQSGLKAAESLSDSSVAACCAGAWGVCGFLTLIALAVTALVWTYSTHNDCALVAPTLTNQTTIICTAICCSVFFQIAYILRIYHETWDLCDMHKAEQDLLKQSDIAYHRSTR